MSVCVCMHICMGMRAKGVSLHACARMWVYVGMHTCACAHVICHVCVLVCMQRCTHPCTVSLSACTSVCTSVHLCVNLCAPVCVHVCAPVCAHVLQTGCISVDGDRGLVVLSAEWTDPRKSMNGCD